MNLLFLDTETTGLKDPHLVQLAYQHSNGSSCTNLFKPPVPIEPRASKVTGIHDEDVKNCVPFEGSDQFQFLSDHLSTSILIAHNARFDMKVLDHYGLKPESWICTLKVARRELPVEDVYKLESLFNSLGLSTADGSEVKAHDAMGDILMMKELLRYMTLKYLYKHSGAHIKEAVDYFVDISMNPLLDKMPFGKHRGLPMEQLPKDYVSWLKAQSDMDPDVLHTISTLKL